MLGNESSMLILMLKTNVPADECSPMELLTKVLGYESSSYPSIATNCENKKEQKR